MNEIYGNYSFIFFIIDIIDSISFENLDTSLCTNMMALFNQTGYNSTIFTLNLGEKFNTSDVTDMGQMFAGTGFKNPSFTLDLGDKFITTNVTNMNRMFSGTGNANSNLVLDLTTFTFDKVDSYTNMLSGFSSTKTIYVKDSAAQSWILNKGFANLSTSNVLIKS